MSDKDVHDELAALGLNDAALEAELAALRSNLSEDQVQAIERECATQKAEHLWPFVHLTKFKNAPDALREFWIDMSKPDYVFDRETHANLQHLNVTRAKYADRFTEWDLAVNRELAEHERNLGHMRSTATTRVWWFSDDKYTTEQIISTTCLDRCPACRKAAIDEEEHFDQVYGDTEDGDAAMQASKEEWYSNMEAQIASLNKRVAILEANEHAREAGVGGYVADVPPKKRPAKKTAAKRKR